MLPEVSGNGLSSCTCRLNFAMQPAVSGIDMAAIIVDSRTEEMDIKHFQKGFTSSVVSGRL